MRNYRNTVACLVLAIMVLSPSSALAKNRDFTQCDGMKAPKKKSPGGMRSLASSNGYQSFGLIGGNSKSKIGACTRALSSSRLLPSHSLRKINLLQMRAIAYAEDGDFNKAIADLDEAEVQSAALRDDALFEKSMGISLKLLRAAISLATGRRDEAVEMARMVAQERPYSVHVQQSSAYIYMIADAETDLDQSPYGYVIRMDPNKIQERFLWLIDQGRFATALSDYRNFELKYPKVNFFSPFAGVFGAPSRQLVTSSAIEVRAAYALAVEGRSADAKALMLEIKKKVDRSLAPAPESVGKMTAPNNLEGPLKDMVEQWNNYVEMRNAISNGQPTDALKLLVGTKIPNNSIGLDLLEALNAGLDDTQKALLPDLETYRATIEKEKGDRKVNFSSFSARLPTLETSRDITEYKESKKSILDSHLLFGTKGSRPDGFKSSEDEVTGIVTVDYTGRSTSAAVVDEQTLLHAADLSRQAGKKGFIILSRQNFSRTRTVTRGYSAIPVSSTPMGYQTSLSVKFVDPSDLPEDLNTAGNRVLIADDIYDQLAPKYISEDPDKAMR